MAIKIRVKFGNFEVDYEGSEVFLEGKLQEVVRSLSEFESKTGGSVQHSDTVGKGEKPSVISLASFLKLHKINSQADYFLATAVWLQYEKGQENLKTRDVTQALEDSRAKKLGNASESLNVNISRGCCEKISATSSKKIFYVTPEGRDRIDSLK